MIDKYGQRFKLLYTRITSLAPGVGLIRSSHTGNVYMLPVHTAQLLQRLKGFAPLREHMQRLSREANAYPEKGIRNPGEEGTWLSLLGDLAQEGFLQTEEDVRRRVKRIGQGRQPGMATPAAIERIGIPTANRPDCLKRAIETFSKQTRKHGREVGFIVMDDSKEETARARNVEVVQMLRQKASIDIKYVDPQMREAQAQEIIRKSGVPEDVVRFALFGPENTIDTYGAPRNALLLETAGEVHIQTDDDTTAEMFEVPCTDNGLALSGRHQVEDCTIFRDHGEIVETLQAAKIDPLAIHERLLGKHPGDVIREFLDQDAPMNIEEIDGPVLDAMCRSDARIMVSFMGAAGDSGMAESYHRIFPGNNEYEQLFDNEEQYDMLLRSRYILRIAPRHIICNGLSCISMSAGIDNRSLLPPFVPCGRGEDTLFGALLKICFPNALKGYIPKYAIQHKPMRVRQSHQGRPQFPSLSSNRLLMYSIMKFAEQPIGEKANALRTIGTMLTNLGEIKQSHFLEYTAGIMSDIIREHVNTAQKALQDDESAPDQWGEDILEYIDSALESVEAPDFGVPSDLSGSISERLEAFQKRIIQFGAMLEYWPEIIDISA